MIKPKAFDEIKEDLVKMGSMPNHMQDAMSYSFGGQTIQSMLDDLSKAFTGPTSYVHLYTDPEFWKDLQKHAKEYGFQVKSFEEAFGLRELKKVDQ